MRNSGPFILTKYTDVFLGVNSSSAYALNTFHDAKTSLNIAPSIHNQLEKEDQRQTGSCSGQLRYCKR
ncbi:MAG: hypothetical protein U0Z17_11675 [Bacteroidales bacterium]